ncbi:MAG: hypothetical protein ACJ76U_11455 [Gaiellaceae bacterium]
MAIRARIAVAVSLLTAAVFAASLASPRAPHSSAATARAACGVERWTAKTLGDRPSLLPTRATTIKYLVTRQTPEGSPGVRAPFERHIFRVTAAVTLVRPEDDGDFHLVLQDSAGRTMIAESPNGGCDRSATAHRQRQMATAHAHVRLCSRASVAGVAFFDFNHGQTGVAANAIELHPILAFRCLSGAVVNASAPSTSTTHPPAVAKGKNSAKLKLISLTSPVRAGADATLVVGVPSGTSCSIVVTYKSGPSAARGLYSQRASGGRISWTWMVGTRTTSGRWPIEISCGAAGSLHTSFVVT